MKYPLFLLVAAAGIALAGSAIAGERTVRLSVPDMTCASCPYIVEGAIAAVDGIVEVKASMDDLSATVKFDDELTDIEAIRAATANVGYPSTVIEDGKS